MNQVSISCKPFADWRPAALVVLLGFLAGCQPQAAVGTLPLPSLSPPVLAQRQPLPPSRPQAISAVRATPVTTARASNAPAGWVAPVPAHAWRYIVIHHSATAAGSAATFDRSHRQRGWDELGYHFVIGNGTNSGDGQIEVGPRWAKQKVGAHAGVKLYNEYGIGICMVGDYNLDRPTSAQMRSLVKLVAYLMKTHGIPAERVLGHRDIKATDCPGRHLSVIEVRNLSRSQALR